MPMRAVFVFAALTQALLGVSVASSHAADVVVFSTVAAKAALEAFAPTFERETQHKLTLRFATAAALKAEIEKGIPCDVALLTAAAIDDLITQGRLAPASRIPVARSGVGMAVKQGASVPPISTPEELKQAVLAAQSIVYSTTGATGPIMKGVFERFGIADVMAAKTLLVSTITAAEAVARGQAEVGFTQISEILDAPGAHLVGPLPAAVQVYSAFAAATAVGTREPAAARAFLDALTTAAAKAVLRAKGLEPN
jgi:molybdate transport system substrate-binding protein